jgi:predicted N-formylglutamate amidohydrolase
MRIDAVLVTCEHASRRVPAAFAHSVPSKRRALLGTHQGFDIGAVRIARRVTALVARLGLPLAGPVEGSITRLFVDLNRSPHHPRIFGPFGGALERAEREALMLRYYLPHHRDVRAELLRLLSAHSRVLHLAVHSFTPVLGRERRNADLGLLYDPKRRLEAECCAAMQAILRAGASNVRVRRNYPYRGNADGLTTMLRREVPEGRYVGIELEFNQRHVSRAGSAVERAFLRALSTLLSEGG